MAGYNAQLHYDPVIIESHNKGYVHTREYYMYYVLLEPNTLTLASCMYMYI